MADGPKIETIGFRILTSTIAHPAEYARFLIQIGHEPLPAYRATSLFGRPKYYLPNVFRYINHIKEKDGLIGCYRGLSSKLAGQIISMVAAPVVLKQLSSSGLVPKMGPTPSDSELSDEEKIRLFKDRIILDVVGKSITVVVSQPFIVITARMMAQFVGGEEQYSGILSSMVVIYKEDGISGFFSGLVPRWVGEVATVVVAGILIFGINNYVIQDEEIKSFTVPTLQYLTTSLMYPFTVVSSCMEVNNSGLAAGMPPHMPFYKSWLACFSYLSKTNKLKRGSSLFFREKTYAISK